MKARLPDGYKKGGDMSSMLKQAQKMQEDMAALQDELAQREYTISAGGGVCTIVITGEKKIKSISLSPQIIDPEDPETLEDILVAAVNEAIGRVEKESGDEMQKLTQGSGLDLGGLL